MVEDLNDGFLSYIGKTVSWIFTPLGWGNWKATVAAFTGLVAKENVVGTLGILYGFSEVAEDGQEIWGTLAKEFTVLSAYSFLVFNLLCAPCFAAMGAIKREMNNTKWTIFAIGYQCSFAYAVSLIIYQFGMFATTRIFTLGTVAAAVIFVVMMYFLFRPVPKDVKVTNVRSVAA
jgi:ferrous iron transport protein B